MKIKKIRRGRKRQLVLQKNQVVMNKIRKKILKFIMRRTKREEILNSKINEN
jgi:hypothetical protein